VYIKEHENLGIGDGRWVMGDGREISCGKGIGQKVFQLILCYFSSSLYFRLGTYSASSTMVEGRHGLRNWLKSIGFVRG